MDARSVRSLRIAIAALFLSAAPVAYAEMYKWIDAEGSVTYSNQPPPDRSNVRELTKIEDINTVPLEKRPAAPVAVGGEIRSSESAAPQAGYATPQPEVPAAKAESVIATPAPPVAKPEPPIVNALPPATLLPQEPVTLMPRDSGAAKREAEGPPPRVIPRSTHTGAVQDPCLTSADPQCHQRNKDSYHPYMGYAPGIQSTGASSGAGAGGAVGGQIPAPRSAVIPPPRRGAQALPPGSLMSSPAAGPPKPSAIR